MGPSPAGQAFLPRLHRRVRGRCARIPGRRQGRGPERSAGLFFWLFPLSRGYIPRTCLSFNHLNDAVHRELHPLTPADDCPGKMVEGRAGEQIIHPPLNYNPWGDPGAARPPGTGISLPCLTL